MSQQSSWPGERQPSDRDIELGIDSLDAEFLSQFKDALRANAVATEDEPLMQMQLDALVRWERSECKKLRMLKFRTGHPISRVYLSLVTAL